MGDPNAERGVGGAVGDGQAVIGLGFIDGRERRAQVRPLVERDVVEMLQRRDGGIEIEAPITSNWSTGVRASSSVIMLIFAVRRLVSAFW